MYLYRFLSLSHPFRFCTHIRRSCTAWWLRTNHYELNADCCEEVEGRKKDSAPGLTTQVVYLAVIGWSRRQSWRDCRRYPDRSTIWVPTEHSERRRWPAATTSHGNWRHRRRRTPRARRSYPARAAHSYLQKNVRSAIITRRNIGLSRITNLREAGSVWEDADLVARPVGHSRQGEAQRADRPTIAPPLDHSANTYIYIINI